MGISLAPDPNVPKPKPAPQVPGQAGGAPPLSLAAPAIPAPTVAAPTAPVNRLDLATNAFDTIEKARAPGDRRALENVTSQAAGLGQLGGGQWRTALTNANNDRQLQLDTARDTLVNKATEGSIADASTAYAQALSGAQQGLASELGHANVDIARQGANTAEKGTLGALGIEAGKLDLAKVGQEAGIGQTQQQIDLAKKAQDINAAYQAGTLTLAQKDQALRELAQSQGNTIATGQLELAKTGQATQLAQEQQKIDLAKLSQAQSVDLAKAGLDINRLSADTAAKAQAALEQYQNKSISLAQRDQTLKELANQQQNDLNVGTLTGTYGAKPFDGDNSWKDLVTQYGNVHDAVAQAAQHGAPLADVQKFLQEAGIAPDRIAKEIQNAGGASAFGSAGTKTLGSQALGQQAGQNQISNLLELAKVIGGPSGNLSPEILAALAKAFGIDLSGINKDTNTTTKQESNAHTNNTDTTDTTGTRDTGDNQSTRADANRVGWQGMIEQSGNVQGGVHQALAAGVPRDQIRDYLINVQRQTPEQADALMGGQQLTLARS